LADPMKGVVVVVVVVVVSVTILRLLWLSFAKLERCEPWTLNPKLIKQSYFVNWLQMNKLANVNICLLMLWISLVAVNCIMSRYWSMWPMHAFSVFPMCRSLIRFRV
jgi:hypothetical protein